MVVKLFILGRPGSGKSTAASIIETLVRCRGKDTFCFNDYTILREMYEAETERMRFSPIEHDAFDVIDFSALDDALWELERRAQDACESKRLVILEFARDDYKRAFDLLNPQFLKDTYFLFIDLPLEDCIERIRKRITCTYTDTPKPDNHYVSEKILRGYYGKECKEYFQGKLREDYSISKYIDVIDNSGSRRDFRDKIAWFVDIMFWQELDKKVVLPLLVLPNGKVL